MFSKSQGNLTCARNFGRRCRHHSIIVATFHKETVWDNIKRWLLFCDREKIDKFNPDINCVLKFLSHLFTYGIGYSGINTEKSAISSLVGVVSNRDIGTHVLIKRFIRGIFIRKPSLPRYNVTWNVVLVLKHLETVNSHSCSLRDLSKKLAMLLALTTGQRVQTLCAFVIRNMEMDMNFVKIRFGDLLKQSRPSFHLDELHIEAFKANYSLCVVGNIIRYLEVTLPLRIYFNDKTLQLGAQWLSGRVLDSRPKGRGFVPHRRHCVVSLSKTHLS